MRLGKDARVDAVLLAVCVGAVLLAAQSSYWGHLLVQMAAATLACASFALLWGQAGLLSFAHALYTGLGAYAALHALQFLGQRPEWSTLWVALVPLAGALVAGLLALVLAPLLVRRAGWVFAMSTLGLGECVAALALMAPSLFGGDAGISANRSAGQAWVLWRLGGLRWDWGPVWQLLSLVLLWVLLGLALLRHVQRSPAGLFMRAVRDRPRRMRMLGYSVLRIRVEAYVLSAALAGLAGALLGLSHEIATPEALSSLRSGQWLLFSLLGGVGHWSGALWAGALMVLALQVLSTWTQAWWMHVGLLFVLLMLYAPAGLSALPWRRAGCIAKPRSGHWPHGGRYTVPLVASALGLYAVLAWGLERVHRQRFVAGGATDARASSEALWVAAGLALLCAALGTWAWRAGQKEQLALRLAATPAEPATSEPATSEPATSEPADSELATSEVPDDIAQAERVARDARAFSEPPDEVLVIEQLEHRYGATRVLQGLDLRVRRGERLALIGANGAGKTTLLHILTGVLRLQKGRVRWLSAGDGEGHPKAPLVARGKPLAGRIARSFQRNQLFAGLSALDHLRCALWTRVPRRFGKAWQRLDAQTQLTQAAVQQLQALGLAPWAQTPAGQLSYAQQRTLDLGLALASEAEVLILDEPTAGLNAHERARMLALIRVATADRTLIMVEHDWDVVERLADRVAVMAEGRIVAIDTPERVLDWPEVKGAYGWQRKPGPGSAPNSPAGDTHA